MNSLQFFELGMAVGALAMVAAFCITVFLNDRKDKK